MVMLNGHLLSDRYQIKDTIGGGGMANVYLARDIILERDVAIKALRLEYANDEEFIARFDREAHSAASLSHPNIVNIYDVGEEDSLLYMVMEYVDGMTLKEYIQKNGPLDVQEALDIMKQIAAAIAHAHANDLVHRDIKPQNILIDAYGQVKVTDFGIAIALSATALTQTNSILGSVHYLSPEQARGGMATKKSDIYSIGIVLYELLTGRLPFSGQSAVSIALKHLQSDTPSVRKYNQDVPQSVENIVLKATAKDPFHRYETIYDLEEALEVALHPAKLNEEVFTPPSEAGEETKAIPIITDDVGDNVNDGDTIIHQTNGPTKPYKEPDKPTSNKKAKKQKKKKDKKAKKQQRKKKKWVIPVIVLLLLVATAVTLFAFPDLFQPKDVTIPDVTDNSYTDAVSELEELGLVVNREEVFSEDIEEGNVVRTSPEASSTVKEGSNITVFISKGKEKVTFENYEGKDFDQVKRLLEDEGYEVLDPYEENSDQPVGEIINQIQPTADSEVVPSETKVIFRVSSGPKTINLNNLKGMTEAEARDYLESNNLTMEVVEENSETTPEREIIRQDPGTNTELEEGQSVTVYISTGPEKKPPVSHTVTFTVPYNPDTSGEIDEEPIEQTVQIYIDDMEHDISEVYKEDTITEDTEYEFTLTIAPDSKAEYIIKRDDDTISEKTVTYEEGE
ncbi:serine/threonine protein kinase [Virgibacillus kapii]|uniref:non-specific serine/threonine protein kinase n=2 Tax=Virgibacillus kapii TaxID=1638645 RepID=A0ABQ2D2R3_9BACI|nr:serine/threonine protein kinase [Virgibacillus kapii]